MKLNRKLITETMFTIGAGAVICGLWDAWRPLGIVGLGLFLGIVAVFKCKPD